MKKIFKTFFQEWNCCHGRMVGNDGMHGIDIILSSNQVQGLPSLVKVRKRHEHKRKIIQTHDVWSLVYFVAFCSHHKDN